MTNEEIYKATTANGMREITEERFVQAMNEARADECERMLKEGGLPCDDELRRYINKYEKNTGCHLSMIQTWSYVRSIAAGAIAAEREKSNLFAEWVRSNAAWIEPQPDGRYFYKEKYYKTILNIFDQQTKGGDK